MRLPLFSLSFILALSVLVCCVLSAEARTIKPITCYAHTQSALAYHYIAGKYVCISIGGCTCTITFCPTLCRLPPLAPSTQQCTFVSNCFETSTGFPIQCAPNTSGTAILCH
jgi:hypothetical protein